MASVNPVANDILSVNGVPLKILLAKAERVKKVKAFMLIIPLLVFLIVTFVFPIFSMLYRSILNPEMGLALPNFSSQILQWDRAEFPPPQALLKVFVEDVLVAEEKRTIGRAAKRLNYNRSGFRSLIKKTGKKLERAVETDGLEVVVNDPQLWERLTAIDKRWKDPEYWVIMQQASPPTTAWFLLQAIDRDYDIDGNIIRVPEERAIHVTILWRSVWISFWVTVGCLALGFPIAYLLSVVPTKQGNILILLLLLPFWTSLLVRTTAWLVLLQGQGLVNDFGIMFGLWDERLTLIRNRFGTYVAMIHILLPFMTLPLWSVMKTIDPYHMKAGLSLGAGPIKTFSKVYFPQTLPGIGAGVLLVFIISLGFYITPALVGGPADQMLSYFIAFHANSTVNWGLASALSVVLMLVVVVFFGLYQRIGSASKVRMG